MYGLVHTVGSLSDGVLYAIGTLESGLMLRTSITALPPTLPTLVNSLYASSNASPSGAASFEGLLVNETASTAARHAGSDRYASGITTLAEPPYKINPTRDVVSENKQ